MLRVIGIILRIKGKSVAKKLYNAWNTIKDKKRETDMNVGGQNGSHLDKLSGN